MSLMKEIDRLANEIADLLDTNPDKISLSQVPGGSWLADVNCYGKNIESQTKEDPIEAMNDLLEKVDSNRFKLTSC